MKKSQSILLTVLFCTFLTAVSVLTLVLPKREFSEFENRYLQKQPRFSGSAILKGTFMEETEEYVSDHIVLRDLWVALKSACERALGKGENNGVYFCSDETLIRRVNDPDPWRLQYNSERVFSLANRLEIPVYFGLIPTAAEIWKDRLPSGAPTAAEAELIGQIYGETAAEPVDFLTALETHKDENVFYRTDHHWSSLGAYYGANALLDAMGLPELAPSELEPVTVSDDFRGTVWSSSGAQWVRPDSIETLVPEDGLRVLCFREDHFEPGSLYVPEKLETKDQYSFFLGGNQPLCVIETQTEGPKLLLVRDSYSDSLAPLLTKRFSEIHLIDLRYYHMSVRDYAEEHGIDAVAVIYGFSMFAEDRYLAFLEK